MMELFMLLMGADASVPVFLGWSQDGQSVALLQHGHHDGSGFPFAYLEIKGPSETNSFFYEFACYEEGQANPNGLTTRARAQAENMGISGSLTGTTLSVRLTDSISVPRETCVTITKNYACDIGAFSLEESRCPGDEMEPSGRVRGFWNNREVFSWGLKGWGFSWWLEAGFVRQGKIALILGHLEPGFEGPDTRFSLLIVDIPQ